MHPISTEYLLFRRMAISDRLRRVTRRDGKIRFYTSTAPRRRGSAGSATALVANERKPRFDINGAKLRAFSACWASLMLCEGNRCLHPFIQMAFQALIISLIDRRVYGASGNATVQTSGRRVGGQEISRSRMRTIQLRPRLSHHGALDYHNAETYSSRSEVFCQ